MIRPTSRLLLLFEIWLLLVVGANGRQAPKNVVKAGGTVEKRRSKLPTGKKPARANIAMVPKEPTTNTHKQTSHLKRNLVLEFLLGLTYVCNSMAVNFPISSMPVIAAEFYSDPSQVAAFVASAASIATLGSGCGKFINGLIVQRLGGRISATMYLAGLALLSMSLSTTHSSNKVGWIQAGMEVCGSVHWTASSLILSKHYEGDPSLFAQGIMSLSLASTIGQFLSKTMGTFLLHLTGDWRRVIQWGSFFSLVGLVAIGIFVTEQPKSHCEAKQSRSIKKPTKAVPSQSLVQTLRHVLGSKLFWQVGVAHVAATLARGTDKVLGAFYHEMSSLPRTLDLFVLNDASDLNLANQPAPNFLLCCTFKAKFVAG